MPVEREELAKEEMKMTTHELALPAFLDRQQWTPEQHEAGQVFWRKLMEEARRVAEVAAREVQAANAAKAAEAELAEAAKTVRNEILVKREAKKVAKTTVLRKITGHLMENGGAVTLGQVEKMLLPEEVPFLKAAIRMGLKRGRLKLLPGTRRYGLGS